MNQIKRPYRDVLLMLRDYWESRVKQESEKPNCENNGMYYIAMWTESAVHRALNWDIIFFDLHNRHDELIKRVRELENECGALRIANAFLLTQKENAHAQER